ncbi:hypothetical protein [Streptomyces sp. NBC_00878]|uniref:hypothetical protein n=1 Tax=Streptomyces sp. NBC_00878 TaxID=2975854 RepID=UPI0022529C66|nr:hypothetical protein [Streptomyces sp. NBC_00878]MCX4911904.1 hypothetical protein [Streptomyces sp. NBC_00878]
MPEITEPERWVIPGILIVAAIGVVVQLWWERCKPTSYRGSRAHRAALREASAERWEKQMAWWAAQPPGVQARHDEDAIEIAAAAEEAARAAAEGAGRVAVERATEINVLNRF